MRISGTEPHQWSLAKESSLKLGKRSPKSAIKRYSQNGWCNSKITLLINSNTACYKFYASTATNQTKYTVELGYMCPRGLTGPPAATHRVVEIQKGDWNTKRGLLLRCVNWWYNKSPEIQFHSILTLTILKLLNATNQPKSTVEHIYKPDSRLLIQLSNILQM